MKYEDSLNPRSGRYLLAASFLALVARAAPAWAVQLVAPTGVTASVVDSHHISVSWTDPNSPAAASYLIQADVSSTFTQLVVGTTTANTSITIGGLDGNTQYFFRVLASSPGFSNSNFTDSGTSPTTPVAAGTFRNTAFGSWQINDLKNNLIQDAFNSGVDCFNGNFTCNQGVVFVQGPTSGATSGQTWEIYTSDDLTESGFYDLLFTSQKFADGSGGTGGVIAGFGGATAVVPGPSAQNPKPSLLGAASDGAGGFVVAWGSGTTVSQGNAAYYNSAGTHKWGPIAFGVTSSAGFLPTPVVIGGFAFFLTGDVASGGSSHIYLQGLSLASGAKLSAANGGKGVDTGFLFSLGGNNVLALAPSPAGGGQANPGVIAFVGAGGASSSVKALRVDNTGAIKWGPTLFSQIMNVQGSLSAAVQDDSSGAYLLWGDIITPAAWAFRVTAGGSAAAGFASAERISNSGDTAVSVAAMQTSSGPVAAAVEQSGSNFSVRAALINTAGGSPPWKTNVTTLSTPIQGLAVSTNAAGLAAIDWGYDAGGTQNLDAAELAISSGAVLVGPINVLQNMPTVATATVAAMSAPAISGTSAYFVLGAAYPPNVYSQEISTFTTLLPPKNVSVTTSTGSATMSWVDGNTSSATFYDAQAATNLSFSANVVTVSTGPPFFNVAFPSLTPNTTYFFHVRASSFSMGEISPFTTAIASSTFAVPPGTPFQISAASNSITVGWDPQLMAVPGTTFELSASPNSNFAAPVSTVTLNTSTTTVISGLASPDANYFVRARVFGNNGDVTSFSANGQAGTTPVPPSAAAYSGVSTNSLTANWTAGGASGSLQYEVDVDSDVNFGFPLIASATTTLTSAVFGAGGVGALLPNTTYYARVKTQDLTGPASSFFSATTALGPVSTFAVPPSVVNITSVTISTVTAGWSADNGPNARYSAVLGLDPAFVTVVSILPVTNSTTAVFGSLSPNTTYYFHVQLTGNNNDLTAFSTTLSTETPPVPPGQSTPTYTGVTPSSFTLNWNSGGNGGTLLYEADVSTDPAFSVFVPSDTVLTSAGFTGLIGNTTYYSRVRILDNGSGGVSPFTMLPSTSTFSNPPSGVGFNVITSTAVTLVWTPIDGPVEQYQAQISTASDFSGSSTSTALLSVTTFTFSGLLPSTTYYGRVFSKGNNHDLSPPSASAVGETLAGPPGAVSPAFPTVSTTSLTAAWSNGGNTGTPTYEVDVATSASFIPIVSSATTTATSASLGGLFPNTTYFAQARISDNGAGSSSTFTFLGSTSSFSVPPSTVTLTAVSSFSVIAAWDAADNGPNAQYSATISTASDFSGASTTTAFLTPPTTSFALLGLAPNTTYYVEVRAKGNNHDLSLFSVAASTITLPGPPGAAATPFTSVSTTSLVFNWTNGGNGGTPVYEVDVATSASFVPIVTSATTTATSGALAGLFPNTTYFAHVKILDNGIGLPSAFGATASTSTLSVPPATVSFVSISSFGVTPDWDTAENGPNAQYSATISTASDFSVMTASSAFLTPPTTSFAFLGLAPSTTYYVEVRAKGNNHDLSGFSTGVSTITLPGPPGTAGTAFTGVTTSSFTYNWTNGGNAGTPVYEADIALSATFASLVSSATTTSTSLGFTSLFPNTTYFARVRILDNGTGNASAFGATSSTSIFSVPPTVVTIVSASSSSVTAGWDTTDNGPNALYSAQISTSPGFVPLIQSSPFQSTTTPSFTFSTGLAPSTTYYIQVRANGNNHDLSAFSSSVSTITLPGPPGTAGTPFTGVTTSSFTYNWTNGGNAGTPVYEADIALSGTFASLVSSGTTTSTSLGFTGLFPNTTYFARVRIADNGTGNASAFGATSSTSTFSVPPSVVTIVSVSSFSATASWDTTDNGPNALYSAQISTSPSFVPVIQASLFLSTTTPSFTFLTGLAPSTTYYVEVRAKGNNHDISAFSSFVSTITLPGPPGTAGTPFTGVTTSSLTFNWTNGGNSGTPLYLAEITSTTFANITSSAATTSLSTGFTGLFPNTTYFARVQIEDNGTGNASAFGATLSTSTFSVPPSSVGFFAVSSQTFTVIFSTTDNSPNALYSASISTNASFAAPVTTSIFVNGSSVAFSGLSTDSTYFLHVRTKGNNLDISSFSVAASTLTLPGSPGAAVPPFSAVTTSGLTFSWTNGGNPSVLLYEADLSTDPAFGVFTASDTALTTASFAGLSANTTYFAHVRILDNGAGNASGFGPTASTSTLANAPSAAAFGPVGASTVTANWGLNGDPAGTKFTAILSSGASPSTNGFAGNQSSTTFNTLAAFFGLLGDTSYYVDVKAINNNNLSTAFTALGSTITTPSAPTGVVGTALGVSSISWTWNSVPAATIYSIFDAGTLTPLGTSATTSFAETALAVNTAYGIVVSAGGPGGTGPLSAAATVYTLANPPTLLINNTILTSSAVFTWNANGNPAGPPPAGITSYEMLFVNPVLGGATTTVLLGTATTNVVLNGLNGGTTYLFTIAALNGNNIATDGAFTGPLVSSGVPAVTQVVGPGGGSITFMPPTGPVTAVVPPGAFGTNVQMTLGSTTTFPTAACSVFTCSPGPAPGVGVDVSLLPAVQPAVPVTLSISYTPASIGSLNPATLFIARYDPVDNVWVPLTSSVDQANRVVTAVTGHLSLFQLMGNVAPQSLSSPRVYPNPFRPSQGHVNVTFANMPPNTVLRIYTLVGEKVREISTDASGMAAWDVKNGAGANVASGVYFVLAESGSDKTTLKVAVQR